MARRVVVLSIDGQPVLSATSYLPVELADDSNAWHQVELGKLAVVGHRVTSADTRLLYSRLPMTMERSSLGISFALEEPIALFVQSYHIHDIQPDPWRAGVIIRARWDHVVWEYGHDYSGLLLQPDMG